MKKVVPMCVAMLCLTGLIISAMCITKSAEPLWLLLLMGFVFAND